MYRTDSRETFPPMVPSLGSLTTRVVGRQYIASSLGSYHKAFRDGCFPSRPNFDNRWSLFPPTFGHRLIVNTSMKSHFPNVKFLFHTFVFLLNTYEIAAFRRLQTKGIRPALGTNVKFLPSCFFETQMYRMENGTLRMGILKTKGHGLSWAR